MEKWRGKVAIVTGASAGIGAGIVRALVQHGLQVVGLDRQHDRLQNLSAELAKAGGPGRLHPVKVDLRKEEEILDAFRWVDEELGGADILVNNAGVLFFDYMSEFKTEQWRAILEINTLAPAICTREFLKSMERRNNQNGHIFVTNSVGGHTTENPGLSMYIASKHAITAMCKILRRELAEKKSTIKVTSISPGSTHTEIDKGTDIERQVKNIVRLDPMDVAEAVINSLSATSKTQYCEVVVTAVPTEVSLY